MLNAKLLKNVITILLLMFVMLGFAGNANASVGTYAGDCQICHGAGGTGGAFKPVAGSSASKIKAAIASQSMMASFKDLTDAQLNSIAKEIGGAADLTPSCTATQDLVNGACVAKCSITQTRNAAGQCVTKTCPTGQTLNTTTGACQITSCPTGQELVNGACVAQCTITQTRNAAGQCVTKTCPTGQTLNTTTGVCQTTSCPTGQELVNGACVAQCTITQTRNAAGQCVTKTCPTGQTLNTTTGVCQTTSCLTGQELVNGACVAQCTITQTRNAAGQCVTKTCPTGQTLNATTGVCETPVTSCPTGQEKINGICVPKCSITQTRNAQGICVIKTCPTGQTLNTTTGQCQTASCPIGKELVKGKCVAKCPITQTRNAQGNCVPKACPTGQKLNPKTGLCVATSTCVLPKKLVNGKCTLTATSCTDAAKEYAAYLKTAKSAIPADDSSVGNKLGISAPRSQAIHAEQNLNLSVLAFGDERPVSMGINLPSGATFSEGFNSTLQGRQIDMNWKVPKNTAGKTLKIKFCAKAANGSTDPNPDIKFVAQTVEVKVLAKSKSLLVTHPSVVKNAISKALYKTAKQRLEVYGLVTWSQKSTIAERKAAIAQALQLSNADTGVLLGTTKVGIDGKWSAVIQLPNKSMPQILDATFQGSLATVLVKKLP